MFKHLRGIRSVCSMSYGCCCENILLATYLCALNHVHADTISMFYIIQYMGLCVFSLPIRLVMIETLYSLSYYHHQIGSMSYYPLFMVRSWNNGVRCMSPYILMNLWYCDMARLLCGTFVSWWYLPRIWPCHWHAALLPLLGTLLMIDS